MRLAETTWPHVEAYFQKSDMVMIAIGSIECHGRHLPVGTDYLIPDHLLSLIEQQNDILIAPTIPYGSCDYFVGFPGSISLGTSLLSSLLEKITDCLYGYGARKFVVLNGHGGNMPAIEEVGYRLHGRGALLAELNWWKMAGQMKSSWVGGHGGAEETAAVLAINEKLVDAEEKETSNTISSISSTIRASGLHTQRFQGVDIVFPRLVSRTSSNGWYGPDQPLAATKEWGTEMLQAVAGYIGDFLRQFATMKEDDNA